MAVDEAFTNLVQYAFPEGVEGNIEIICSLFNGEFTVRMKDDGRFFDTASVRTPDLTTSLEDREIGGLGIYFIDQIMDTVSYEFDLENNGCKTLTMVKSRQG